MTRLLAAEHLSKRFGDKQALDDVSLEIQAGTAVGLVGPNGAGKSTFLRCAIGLCHPDAGGIAVEGFDARRNPLEVLRRVSYLPGETSLYKLMTGREQLDFALGFHDSIDEEVLELCLDTFRLPLGKKVRAYSGGMKQQLAVTIALSPRVPLYILDEPHKALDASMRHDLRQLLIDLHDRGRTMLISSHQLRELGEVADRLEFLRDGRHIEARHIQQARETLARRILVGFSTDPGPLDLPAGVTVERHGLSFSIHQADGRPIEEIVELVLAKRPASLSYGEASLEDIYEALYVTRSDEAAR